jgi:hypothetical protein
MDCTALVNDDEIYLIFLAIGDAWKAFGLARTNKRCFRIYDRFLCDRYGLNLSDFQCYKPTSFRHDFFISKTGEFLTCGVIYGCKYDWLINAICLGRLDTVKKLVNRYPLNIFGIGASCGPHMLTSIIIALRHRLPEAAIYLASHKLFTSEIYDEMIAAVLDEHYMNSGNFHISYEFAIFLLESAFSAMHWYTFGALFIASLSFVQSEQCVFREKLIKAYLSFDSEEYLELYYHYKGLCVLAAIWTDRNWDAGFEFVKFVLQSFPRFADIMIPFPLDPSWPWMNSHRTEKKMPMRYMLLKYSINNRGSDQIIYLLESKVSDLGCLNILDLCSEADYQRFLLSPCDMVYCSGSMLFSSDSLKYVAKTHPDFPYWDFILFSHIFNDSAETLEMLQLFPRYINPPVLENSPFFFALKCGHIKTIDYFVKCGIDLTRVINPGLRFVCVLGLFGHRETSFDVIKYLLDHGANPNFDNGLPLRLVSTWMYHSTNRDRFEKIRRESYPDNVIDLLVKSGADPEKCFPRITQFDKPQKLKYRKNIRKSLMTACKRQRSQSSAENTTDVDSGKKRKLDD